jgi:hypothetical protein
MPSMFMLRAELFLVQPFVLLLHAERYYTVAGCLHVPVAGRAALFFCSCYYFTDGAVSVHPVEAAYAPGPQPVRCTPAPLYTVYSPCI